MVRGHSYNIMKVVYQKTDAYPFETRVQTYHTYVVLCPPFLWGVHIL